MVLRGRILIIKTHDYMKCREALGREASPTACIIDSQSMKGAEKEALH